MDLERLERSKILLFLSVRFLAMIPVSARTQVPDRFWQLNFIPQSHFPEMPARDVRSFSFSYSVLIRIHTVRIY
jgi:hypothetical protein